MKPSSSAGIERLIGGETWSATTALESGEMVSVGTIAHHLDDVAAVAHPIGLRLSRAVFEDCRRSGVIIRDLAAQAAADGPGRPARRARILAPVRGKHGTRAAVVELVARSRGGWVEVRMEGEA